MYIDRNVVTHKNHRGKGYASECMEYVKSISIKQNCYKMMLLTDSKEEKTFNFYQKAGYNSIDKIAFIQVFDY
ncbi:MAG: GNAT family N-acetyltransferase [Thomasclavelia sp.]|uniref:GNAT family N-acetyltransferase n=1 Tax=Thomasclavelia sp. TaxID=3025757 RepID=UPI00399FE383